MLKQNLNRFDKKILGKVQSEVEGNKMGYL